MYLLAAAVSAAVLYGGSYQQFRFFDLAHPGGAVDAADYLAMAHSPAPSTVNFRQYRWITPALARGVHGLTALVTVDPDLSLRLAFYVVNFAFSLGACLLLFATLRALAFNAPIALIGASLFASSRVIVLVTGTPMADAVFFCAIAALAYLMVSGRATALALALPVLALSKEIFLPFVLLPLLTDMRRSTPIRIAVPIAVVAFALNMYVLERLCGISGPSLVSTVADHAAQLGEHARDLFSPAGLADLQSGFSLTLLLTLAGAWIDGRRSSRRLPAAVIAMLPIAVVLIVFSGNAGRMLFAAFPAIIAYAMLAIETVLPQQRGN